MSALTHSQFLVKLNAAKLIAEDYAVSQSWKVTGEKFSMTAMRAGIMAKYYERHKNDPMQPVLGCITHKDCCDLARTFKLNDIDSVRAQLIRDFSSVETMIGRRKDYLTKRLIRIVMKHSGLEWFEKSGRPVIHWKHQAP